MKPDNSDTELIDRALGFLRSAAMSGYGKGEAACELAGLFHIGQYVASDYKQAVTWYRTAAQKLNNEAYFFLGYCYYFGEGLEKDFAKAFDYFFKGAMTGCRNGFYMLGDMFKNGEFVDRNPALAFRLYLNTYYYEMDSFENENYYSSAYPSVCLRLGEAYLYGIGVERSIEEANEYFSGAKKYLSHLIHYETPELLKLADDAPFDEDFITNAEKNAGVFETSGMPESEFIALMAEKLPKYNLQYYPEKELNEICVEDPWIDFFDETFQEIYEGVQEDDSFSMFMMAIICCQGDKNFPKNPVLFDYGVYLLHQSLLGGCKDALPKLGLVYHLGKGVSVDYAIALFLYNLSEDPLALGQIGVCYANGQGVEKDYRKAYQYLVESLLLMHYKIMDDEGFMLITEALAAIYPHLTYLDSDQAFIASCYNYFENKKEND